MPTKLQVLQDHCQEFEHKLQSCGSTGQAHALQQEICDRLCHRCGDDLLRTLLTEHAQALIRARFAQVVGPDSGS